MFQFIAGQAQSLAGFHSYRSLLIKEWAVLEKPLSIHTEWGGIQNLYPETHYGFVEIVNGVPTITHGIEIPIFQETYQVLPYNRCKKNSVMAKYFDTTTVQSFEDVSICLGEPIWVCLNSTVRWDWYMMNDGQFKSRYNVDEPKFIQTKGL